jgi:hypothetical protein
MNINTVFKQNFPIPQVELKDLISGTLMAGIEGDWAGWIADTFPNLYVISISVCKVEDGYGKKAYLCHYVGVTL